MRKYLLAILIILWAIVLLPRLNTRVCLFRSASTIPKIENIKRTEHNTSIKEAFALLKGRKDNAALVIFEKILLTQPDNIDCLWGKAEVFRRAYKFQEAKSLLSQICKKNPQHIPSLISLSYIRYKDDNLDAALKLIHQVLQEKNLDRENKALAYLMLGTINSRRSVKGWFLDKLTYGTRIKGYFLKAQALAPDLPEVHLGLGAFYLKAPGIVGGNLHKAVEELELAVKIAPDFATANARLAQAYKRKGDLDKYNFYFKRAKELDPENEALKESQ